MNSAGKVCISIIAFSLALAPVFAQGLRPQFERAQFPAADMAEVKLGQLLFYDPILSGNKKVACATCHHPRFATSDGLPLGLGDGGIGLGPERRTDPENLPEKRVPRNSPALFNLGAAQFISLFHDGRLEFDASRPSNIRTPLDDEMVAGFDSVLSAQAMFPVLSPDEMAGHYLENDVAKAVRMGLLTGENGAWDIIAKRVRGYAQYQAMFDEVLEPNSEIEFTDIANAIAAFVAFEWRADDSPFDRYIFEGEPLTELELRGLDLFYGKANCVSCHAGLFQTDNQFHAIAMPQIGPGKAARFEDHADDTGRMHVTGKQEDAFKFRTPSLRNVELTGPYGHAGAFGTLRDVVVHHLDPVASLAAYELNVKLPELASADDQRILRDPTAVARIGAANELQPILLNDEEIEQLLAFLQTLTDKKSIDGRLGVPLSVPSGLPVDQ